ncbi:adenylate/guanylate cyclase domain-containing protein [Deltaproteobacteria bacterium Smac51]|nr:adenylate/guanylate cyclase domain-containing protein [Deltaproteobacteria bacterium Smac51]
MIRFGRLKKLTAPLLIAGIIVAVFAAYIGRSQLMVLADAKIYDTWMHFQKEVPLSDIPVVIDIDERSLAQYGQWPWPRYLLADLVDKLRQKGVAAIGLDILLIEDDRTSPALLQRDLKRFRGLDLDLSGLPENMFDYDQMLADTLRDAPVVLGMYAYFDGRMNQVPPGAFTPSHIVRGAPGSPFLDEALTPSRGASVPLEALRQAAPVGLLNLVSDRDGVARRIQMAALINDEIYLTLAVRVLMAAMGVDSVQVWLDPYGLTSISVGDLSIPLNTDGSFNVYYKGGRRKFAYFSAGDVLGGHISDEELAGRIAFVGASAPGLMDLRLTPFERVYPGVEIHADVLDAIATGHYLVLPPWSPAAQAGLIVFLGLISGVAFGFSRPRVYLPVGVVFLVATVYGSLYLFREHNLYLSPLYGALVVALMGAGLVFMRFWEEEKQKRVLRRSFARYVAPTVVERIARRSGDIFSGEELEVTIMFTDIRGFTTMSESLAPREIVSLLNRYFTRMTALVRQNGGTMDKFIGDALMAFWNAPVPVPNHPRLAVETALAMQESLQRFNDEQREGGGKSLAMGVGLHTGKVFVGNMGSEELLNYTIIGDNVNLASRLEGLCSVYGVEVVVSEETATLCGPSYFFQPLDVLRVKGKHLPVSVFIPLRRDEANERKDELIRHRWAISLYQNGDFSGALESFSALAADFPIRIYQVYCERCLKLADSPPEDWDGVWVMTSK